MSPAPVPTSSRVQRILHPASRLPTLSKILSQAFTTALVPPNIVLRRWMSRSSARTSAGSARGSSSSSAPSISRPQVGVAAAVIEERAPVRNRSADDEPQKHRVVPGRQRRLLGALDVGQHALEHGQSLLVLMIAEALEEVLLVLCEAARDRLQVRRAVVGAETPSGVDRGVLV